MKKFISLLLISLLSLIPTAADAQKFIQDAIRADISLVNAVAIGDTDVNAIMRLSNGAKTYYTAAQLPTLPIVITIGGNYTATLPQKPYNVDLSKVGFSGDTAVSICGMTSAEKFRFLANYADLTHGWRNAVFLDVLGIEMMTYPVQMVWCEVYIDATLDSVDNPVYYGLYQFAVRVRRGSSLPKSIMNSLGSGGADQTTPNITGSYLVEIDQYALEAGDWAFTTTTFAGDPVKFKIIYPKGDNITAAQKTYIEGQFDSLNAEILAGDLSRIDIPSWSKFLAICELTKQLDYLNGSSYFVKKRNDPKIYIYSIWDADISMGLPAPPGVGTTYTELQTSPRGMWAATIKWTPSLLAVPEFAAATKAQFKTHMRNMNKAITYIDNNYPRLKASGAFSRNFAVWDYYGTPVTASSLDAEVATLRKWLVDRINYIRDYYFPATRMSIRY